MSLGCADLERVLLDGSPALLTALTEHARGCPACARELRGWQHLSQLAPGLQKRWDSPRLQVRIERALAAQAPPPWRAWLASPPGWWRRPILAFGLALVLVGAGAGLWLTRTGPAGDLDATLAAWQAIGDPLLTDQAVDEVEAAERQYVAAIERLSKLARPAATRSPLVGSYREKLALLDAAIAELQAGIAGNRLNSHLRRELLTLYQEKQETLRDLTQIAGQPERQGDIQ